MTTLSDIADTLARHAEALAAELLGPPVSRRGGEWRWGRKGSLKLDVAGERRGRWRCWETGEHGDLLDLIRRVRGDTAADALRWARMWLGMPAAAHMPGTAREAPRFALARVPAMPRQSPPEPEQARMIDCALAIWDAAQALRGGPAEAYLRGRMLSRLPDEVAASLRFHPRCPRGGGPEAERLPALVALLRDIRTDQPCGIRRIFIEPDGGGGWRKASGGSEKMALGRAGGACVKLTPDEDVTHGLFLAEGVETALALICVGLAPVWAAGDAGNIRAFPVLPGIECLTILADRDASGTGVRAARSCAARWVAAGCEVRIIPPRASKDWNDVLRGAAA